KAGFSLRADEGLVAENAGLTEWPTPMIGTIDDLFMDVPAEVLITSMKTHQRYFAVERPDGSLAPHFVLTSNMVTDDGGAVIVAGNERVLRARLADAKFFWDQDRKTRLADRADTLANITFHAELGTMAEKAARLEGLAGTLCGFLDCSETDARRAAWLAKCDLVSGMVGEFPELQGTMGAYYARSDGEPTPVADAIADHYAPQGPADRCPTLGTSVAVALADKLDTLAGFFAIDEKPTGSRDPFALRRAALGVIRLIVENGVRLPLRSLFARSVSLYQLGGDADAVADDLMVFIADRLKVALREKGVRHDLVDSVFALSGEDDLVRLLARVDALGEFLEGEDGTNLLTAYRRAANISRIEANKGDDTIPETVSGDLLRQDEERGLADMLDGLAPRLTSALEGEDFVGAMGVIANLRQPMDAFFDNVTVNADEPELRRNRLALLQQITTTMNQIADFSRVAS
ncbi:MAG: glycine--tRNA ligase subunit beta, partial [Pseudomonadota bacterium]